MVSLQKNFYRDRVWFVVCASCATAIPFTIPSTLFMTFIMLSVLDTDLNHRTLIDIVHHPFLRSLSWLSIAESWLRGHRSWFLVVALEYVHFPPSSHWLLRSILIKTWYWIEIRQCTSFWTWSEYANAIFEINSEHFITIVPCPVSRDHVSVCAADYLSLKV